MDLELARSFGDDELGVADDDESVEDDESAEG